MPNELSHYGMNPDEMNPDGMSPDEANPGVKKPAVQRPVPRSKGLRLVVPGLLVLGILGFGFGNLHQYNITWDDALGDLFYGQRYLSFFLSLDPVYLDFTGNPYPPGHTPDLSASPFRGRPWEYYPVANTLAAATSAAFSSVLGWMDPFDGFHAVNLFFAAILAWVLFRFLERRFDWIVALGAVAFLFGSPRMVAHMMANIKDFPLMVLFSLGALTFFRAFESGSARGLWLFGVLLGLALGTKANALFLPLIPALTLLLGGVPEPWRGREARLLSTLIGAGALGVVVMVATWPYLWSDPIGGFSEHLKFVLSRKDSTSLGSVAPVYEAIIYTTPPFFLIAFALGSALSIGPLRRRHRPLLFLWAWIAVVLGRYLLPQAVNYDGVRHFLELFPPMAAIAAFGIVTAAGRIVKPSDRADRTQLDRALVAQLAAVLLFTLPGIAQVFKTHPFHLAYWSSWVGGYPGARASDQPQASDYWGLSYRLGMRWLNENAERDAFLAVPVVEHAVRLVAPTRLRPDIQLLPITTPFSPHIQPERLRRTLELSLERPLYVMFVERRDWMNPLMVDCLRRLEPVKEWQLEGAPILQIYRYQPPRRGERPEPADQP